MRVKAWVWGLLQVFVVVFPMSLWAETRLRVFAAASLSGVLEAVVDTECCGDVQLTYAASGTLARQIEAGAPADVVILANDDWMQWLVGRDLVRDPRVIASNGLVLVSADPTPLALTPKALAIRLGETGRIALGDPRFVPAGRYGEAALRGLGLWETLDERKVLTQSVRGALAFALREEVMLAVIYASDLQAAPGLTKLADLPLPDSVGPIAYPAAPINGASDQAGVFIAFLLSPQGQSVLKRHGFHPPRDRQP